MLVHVCVRVCAHIFFSTTVDAHSFCAKSRMGDSFTFIIHKSINHSFSTTIITKTDIFASVISVCVWNWMRLSLFVLIAIVVVAIVVFSDLELVWSVWRIESNWEAHDDMGIQIYDDQGPSHNNSKRVHRMKKRRINKKQLILVGCCCSPKIMVR